MGAELISKWKKLPTVINLYMFVGAISTAIVNSSNSIWWGTVLCFVITIQETVFFFLGSLMIELCGEELHCATKRSAG